MGIDMSPMIDCVFQLLIFFMLSSSFLTPAIHLALPNASVTDQTEAPEISVTVTALGEYYVNSEKVAANELEARLRPLIASSKTKIVTFRGDQNMRYQAFIDALDAARASGAVHLNIAHQPAQ
jgi:biopolymer transport protein ExbD